MGDWLTLCNLNRCHAHTSCSSMHQHPLARLSLGPACQSFVTSGVRYEHASSLFVRDPIWDGESSLVRKGHLVGECSWATSKDSVCKHSFEREAESTESRVKATPRTLHSPPGLNGHPLGIGEFLATLPENSVPRMNGNWVFSVLVNVSAERTQVRSVFYIENPPWYFPMALRMLYNPERR